MGFGIVGASSASAYSQSPFTSGPVDPASQPGPNPLVVGPVPFANSECPDNLKIGLEVKYTSKHLIGGGLATATFGAFPKPISWTGRIWGPNVEARKAQLRQMMVAQNEVVISWTTERYYCIVVDFDADFMAVDANYSITIVVTRDANGSLTSATPVPIDTQLSSLSTQASEQASSIALVDAAGALPLTGAAASVKSSLASAGPVAQLSGSSLTSTLNTVQAAQGAAATYLAAVGVSAPQFLPASQLVTSFGLIARNIAQGQSANSIQTVGGSLAEISVLHYGTPDYGPQIGAANGILGDRLAPGILRTLVLPPFPVVVPT